MFRLFSFVAEAVTWDFTHAEYMFYDMCCLSQENAM